LGIEEIPEPPETNVGLEDALKRALSLLPEPTSDEPFRAEIGMSETYGTDEYDILLSRIAESIREKDGEDLGDIWLSKTRELESHLHEELINLKEEVLEWNNKYPITLCTECNLTPVVIGEDHHKDTTSGLEFDGLLDKYINENDTSLKSEVGIRLRRRGIDPRPRTYVFYFPLNIRFKDDIPEAINIDVPLILMSPLLIML